jgi:formate dehydrogenase major subunit
MVKAMINNYQVEVEEGTTILQAAETCGIEIPTLCYLKDTTPEGSCRLCVVEIEGHEQLVTACSSVIHEGDVIHTESERVVESRKMTLDLLMARHETQCMACQANGECKLQKYSNKYDVAESSFKDMHQHMEIDDSNKFFVYNPNLCIRCHRCINACYKYNGLGVLRLKNTGTDSVIAPVDALKWSDSNCESCGNCVSNCPTGALLPKSQNKFNIWDTKEVQTTCTYCGVGCQIKLLVQGDKVVDARPANGPVNKGVLCVKGRFAFDFINNKRRLKHPMVRKNGKLEEVSWDEAYDVIASKIKEVKEEFGPDAISGFSSARCSNEENYIFQKFIRAAIGTNNVDHCARLCHSSTVAGLATTLGSGAMTNPIRDVLEADVIFITGSNTTVAHPVMGMMIRQAVREGKKLIVADPKRIDLADYADIYLQIKPGTSVALTNTMLNIIFAEGLEDKEYIEAHTEGIDELRASVQYYTPEMGEKITGVDKELIKAAARLYASTHKSYIAYAMGITQHLNGTNNVMSMSNLALVTGNLGRTGTGVNPLRGQNNVQGACDMGALPTDYPAYQKVFNPEVRQKFEKAWGVPLSPNKGLEVTRTIPAMMDGRIKLLYVMGENPMVSDPNSHHVAEAMEKAFVVVQDLFLTETAELADVVLPVTCFAEKTGTFTNTERRVQMLNPAVPPKGESKQDWQVIMDLMNRLGYECHYDTAEDIFNEMRTVTPSYAGITYKKIRENEGICWPCPTEDHPGTPILYLNGPTRSGGKGLLKAMDWAASPETEDEAYPITLMTCRILYHYHTRTMTDRTVAVHYTAPRNYIELNRQDAMEKNIEAGDWVSVSSPRGTIFCEVHIEDALEPGVAWMPFHYAEGANVLTDSDNLDPVCMIPGYKQVGVKVEKVNDEMADLLTEKAMNNELEYFNTEAKDILWYQELTGDIGEKNMMGLFNIKDRKKKRKEGIASM